MIVPPAELMMLAMLAPLATEMAEFVPEDSIRPVLVIVPIEAPAVFTAIAAPPAVVWTVPLLAIVPIVPPSAIAAPPPVVWMMPPEVLAIAPILPTPLTVIAAFEPTDWIMPALAIVPTVPAAPAVPTT